MDRPADAALPWEMRLLDRLPLPAFAAGAAVAVTVFAVYVVEQWVHGFPSWTPRSDSPFPYSAVTHAAALSGSFLGYGLGAYRYAFDATSRELAKLAPGARLPATGRGAGWVGAFSFVLLYLWLRQAAGPVSTAHLLEIGRIGGITPVAGFLLCAVVVGRLAFFTLRTARGAADLAVARAEIDLWDLGWLAGFGRIGLRLALIWIVAMTIFSVGLLTDPNPEDVPARWPLVVGTLAVACLALLRPVRGVQRRVREAKRAEIARIDAEVRALREAPPEARPGRISDLLAMRSFVEGLREWPFDAPTLTRFALYLLIPLGSWLGGAFVERGLSALLD